MSLQASTPRTPPRNGAGEAALCAGVVALVFALVPIVGDYVAVPAALAAIGLGTVGYVRAERGLATNPGRALLGGLLGLVAGFVVFVSAAAMGTFG